jgi:hypothetical protein
MELTKAHLFVMLLLALVLCSFFGGDCGDGLEGFTNSPYQGKGQYSDQHASYAKMYSDNHKYAKSRDDDAITTTKYAPYTMNKKANYGIRANQIIPGNEDLYILKSEVIPPVCPVCPAAKCNKGSKGENAEKCPPCPPCARCPEPAFDCKKVPNYNRVNDDSMPYPVLASFNQFGL